MSNNQMITVQEAAQRTGLHLRTLERRLQSGQFQVFRDPLDRRRRLIPESELERLTQLNPIRYEAGKQVDDGRRV